MSEIFDNPARPVTTVTTPLSEAQLIELITREGECYLKTPGHHYTDAFIDRIDEQFPALAINQINYLNLLMVSPCVHVDEVIRLKKEILSALSDFHRTAHKLMYRLCDQYNLEPGNQPHVHQLKRNSHKQRGPLGTDWTFFLHGTSCAFENKITGQFLDVKICHKTQYGVIDNYFLRRFIETTPTHDKVSKLIAGKSQNMHKILSTFKRMGYLIEEVDAFGNYQLLYLTEKSDYAL
ncbi:hypothetical protein FUAX_54590 (plasmid) [Fulvitalea axinellae]|uniref:DUF6896 domain-containing protein n=1 Tax=Fulvitalea axinellae TaxID=1182444 RepID=A0AAU9D6L2_9BACT|nr:hypothetical protein FUAX_54590 [Fulvitalea axinellae]